jgi:archaetidylinositol phosphate synthase
MVIERLRGLVSLDAVGRKIPLSPNTLTLASLAVAACGIPLAWLYHLPAWIFILAASALDALDGAVARSRGLATRRGAFLDSAVDRYADALYLLYFWPRADHLSLYVALIGTFIVSYARCRGESLGLSMRGVGLMERGERVALLVAASIVQELVPPALNAAILAYAVLVNAAAAHRCAVAFARLRRLDRG